MKSGRNQKLTDSQIHTIKHLRRKGYPVSVIAKVTTSLYGIAISTVYYHAHEVEYEEKQAIRTLIRTLLREGKTTADVAELWDVPLSTLNRLYVGKHVV